MVLDSYRPWNWSCSKKIRN